MTKSFMQKSYVQFLASIAMLFSGSSLAFAQGTITDGPSEFALTASSFDISPEVNFKVPNPTSVDHMYEQGWWFRITGDTSETVFPLPSTQNYAGNMATLTWANVGGRNFAANQTITIKSGGATSARTQLDLTITNNTGAVLSIELFHMADFDLRGSASFDVATLASANDRIALTDTGGTGTAEYHGVGANAFLVRAFASGTDVAGLLSNSSVNNFNNTALPFSGDFTGGFQFSRSIAIGGTTKVSIVLAVNEPANSLIEACVLPNSSCQVLNQTNCAASSGNYFADTTCLDSDGDGRADIADSCPVDPAKFTPGSCGCGVADTDTDADGTPNCADACATDPQKISAGICGCGTADIDANNNGAIDCVTQAELKARLASISKLVNKLKLKDGVFTKAAKTAKNTLGTEAKSLRDFTTAKSAFIVLSNPKANLSKLSKAISSTVGKARKGARSFNNDKKAALKAIKDLNKLVK